LFSGTNVRTVLPLEGPGRASGTSQAPGRWRLAVALTAHPERTATLHAKRVILAAGTFGSTEILMRSRDEGGLRVSDHLGQGYSSNGDMLGFSFGQESPVLAAASTPSVLSDHRSVPDAPGPTAVAAFRTRLDNGAEAIVEDGAIPFPLRSIWAELLGTGSLARRLVEKAVPGVLRGADPAAVPAQALRRAQVLMVMGQESATGVLDWSRGDGAGGYPFLTARRAKPSARDPDEYFEAVDRLFGTAEENGGFEGGQYLPSPPWKPVGDPIRQAIAGFDEIMTGTFASHPLGGVPMGISVSEGVVDVTGAVFDPAGGPGDTHDGLYVVDGSIFPSAIGTNPLLTISAMSDLLVSAIGRAAAGDDDIGSDRPLTGPAEPTRPPRVPKEWTRPSERDGYPVADPGDERVSGVLRERLILDLFEECNGARTDKPALREQLGRILGVGESVLGEPYQRLVIDVEMPVEDLNAWLERDRKALPARFRVYRSRGSGDTAPSVHLEPVASIPRKLEGTVDLGYRDDPGSPIVLGWRIFRAVLRFFRLRGREVAWRVQDAMKGGFRGLRGGTEGGLWRFVTVSLVQARLQAHWRELRYRFEAPVEGGVVRFSGAKPLRYAGRGRDPLNALRFMDFELERRDARGADAKVSETLRVDMIRFLDELAPFQTTATPGSPASVLAMLRFGAYFVRALVQTHFWSFAAPPYERYRSRDDEHTPRLTPPPDRVHYPAGGSSVWSSPAERFHWRGPDGVPRARLTRYRPAGMGGEHNPILLVHGLAHGSAVFYTPTVETNLVQWLLGAGRDVWLLDHRLSVNLHCTPDPNVTIDAIACEDIDWAIGTVRRALESEGSREVRLDVFAHCIGSAAFGMWVLAPRLDTGEAGPGPREDAGIVAAAVYHAVPPWIHASLDNRWRAGALSRVKNAITEEDFDPIPNARPTVLETLIDRFAFSFGWNAADLTRHRNDEQGARFSRTICDRMTFYYGDEWEHGNLTPATHAALETLVGPAPLQTLLQAWYCVVRGALTTRDDENRYVVNTNFRARWRFPTLFLHGSNNKVFNAESSRLAGAKLARIFEVNGVDASAKAHIVPGYGHMDMLFGARAATDVFPILHGFLAGGDDPPKRSAPAELRSHLSLPRVTTGPVLSVRDEWIDEDGHEKLRRVLEVWCETGEYETYRPAVVTVSLGPVRARAVPKLFPGQPALLGRSVFWLAQLDIDAFRGNAPADEKLVLTIEPAPDMLAWATALLDPLEHRRLGSIEVRALARAWERFSGVPPLAGGACSDRTAPGAPPAVPPLPGAAGHPACSAPGSEVERVEVELGGLPWFRRLVEGEVGGGRGTMAFLLGSCLYPGSPFDQRLSDAIWGTMGPHLEGTDSWAGVDHALFVGDQIYADATADIFDAKVPYQRFRDRYRRAWGGPGREKGRGAAGILSRLPVYFAVDDHELEDDWAGGRRRGTLFRDSFREAWLFQMQARQSGPPRLWYDFERCGYRHFVLDTRFERTSKRLRHYPDALMSGAQRRALAAWVGHASEDELLFIVAGSPLALLSHESARHPETTTSLDHLLAYPGFLGWLASTLGGRRLVWLCGNPHLSCVSEVKIAVDDEIALDAVQICGSGLFAPLPFANAAPAHFHWAPAQPSVTLPGSAVTVTACQRLVCAHPAHFLRAELGPPEADRRQPLSVTAFCAGGTGSGTETVRI